MEETHVYTVTPWRPIRGLVKGKLITKPTNLNLTKDEVLMCMKHGPVYRKFYLDGSERVTPSNLDRLHRSEHLTEEQYKALCEKLVKEDTTKVEEGKIEEEIPNIEDTEAEVGSKVSEEESEEEVIPDEEEIEESKKEEEEQSSIEDDEEIDRSNIDLLSNPVDIAPKKKGRKNKKKSSALKSNNTEAAQKDE